HAQIAHLPLAERVRRLRDPETKRRMLAEHVAFDNPVLAYLATAFHKLFPLGDPPDYEPSAEASIAAVARRRGVSPEEGAYDLLLGRRGREPLYVLVLHYAD